MAESTSSELIPAITSASAAVSALAFFRPWIAVSLGEAADGSANRSGAALAGEMSGPIPWLYITLLALTTILALSYLALFSRSRNIRIAFGSFLAGLAAAAALWPFWPISRILANKSRLSAIPNTAVAVTPWWWLYSASLAVIFVFAIIELVKAARTRTGL